MSKNSGYLATVRVPGIGLVLVGGILGRLTYGIIPFATVLAFSAAHGFAAAGLASAGFMAGNALLAPVRGRIVDRRGPRTLFYMAGIHRLAVLGTAVLIPTVLWVAAVVLLAAAGATIPPIGPALRTSWSRLAPNKDILRQVHALDSVVEELTFVVAPLLTVALVAATSSRWTIFLGAVLLVPAVAAIVRFGRIDRADEQRPASAPGTTSAEADRRPLMLRPQGQGIVIPIITLGTVGGGLAILLPALAERAGSITAAGYAFAAYSLGGAVAGLIYGRLRWDASLRVKYTIVTACFAIGVALLIPAASIVLTMIAVFLAGGALTPIFIVAYLLVDERIEQNRLTEANSWLSSGYNIGSASGSALCGLLVSATTPAVVATIYTAVACLGILGSLRVPRHQPDKAPSAALETAA